jgi:predicted DNA-binding transcriptional regulator YafY
MQIRVVETFKLKDNIKIAVGFEQNPYLQGLNFFTNIFNAIQNEVVLKISYKGFKQNDKDEFKFHPWYLKQFNNRWFVFGFNEKFKSVSNLALDRIFSVNELKTKFKSNSEIDFEEYFEDIIGVTVNQKISIEKIKIKIKNDVWPYIESKPLHGSQKIISRNQQFIIIEITVQPNHELFALLFSYLDSIEVLEPISIRNKIKLIVKSQFDKYF